MRHLPKCEFWDFSLAVYGRAAVAPACLALQERYGTDVNLLFFCCWLAASGRGALEGEALARAAAAVEPWHREIVRGLRVVRVRLRAGTSLLPEAADEALLSGAAELRRKVAALELEAEHIEQLLLAGLAPPPQPEAAAASPAARARAAARSAMAYLASLGAPLDAADRRDLRAVLAGIFPALEEAALAALLAHP
jgi:uncharacterized protein (TIGR02444 family)